MLLINKNKVIFFNAKTFPGKINGENQHLLFNLVIA